MPSFEQPIVSNRIIITAGVSRQAGDPVPYHNALVDTGAMITAISPGIVRSLDLLPIGTDKVVVASGKTVDVFLYNARVDIPIEANMPQAPPQHFLSGGQLDVVGLPYQPDNYDVILGMDLITAFHITIYQNRIILSN